MCRRAGSREYAVKQRGADHVATMPVGGNLQIIWSLCRSAGICRLCGDYAVKQRGADHVTTMLVSGNL